VQHFGWVYVYLCVSVCVRVCMGACEFVCIMIIVAVFLVTLFPAETVNSRSTTLVCLAENAVHFSLIMTKGLICTHAHTRAHTHIRIHIPTKHTYLLRETTRVIISLG